MNENLEYLIDKWVIVKDHKIVAYDTDFNKCWDKAEKAGERYFVIKYIHDKYTDKSYLIKKELNLK